MSDLALEFSELSKVLRHEGGKWVLYSHDGSKHLGTFDTKEEALDRERQIAYFKHVAKSDLEVEFVKDNPCHVPSGPKGGQFCELRGGVAGAADIEFKPSAKMLRAIQARVPCGVEKQRVADQQEAVISRALGLTRTGDNSAFDLLKGRVGVEVKTMVDSRNGKITMSSSALARKNKEARRDRLRTYTIVADKRAGKTQYYASKGLGSFRVGSMTPVTISELREFVK